MRSVVVAASAGFVLLAACGETTNSFYGTASSKGECDRLRAEIIVGEDQASIDLFTGGVGRAVVPSLDQNIPRYQSLCQ